MPSQIPFPGAGDPAIGLIETMRWSREAGFDLLTEHMARLEDSASVCGFAVEVGDILLRLSAFAGGLHDSPSRVRLALFPNGRCDVTHAPLLDHAPAMYRVAVAAPRHRAGDPWLSHKTTSRERYERPLARAVAEDGADEVLFLNERDELCEGARTNLFVESRGVLLTPPLACGVLPGTLRAHLLEAGRARETVLRMSDIGSEARWFMGNSVRGLVPASLVRR